MVIAVDLAIAALADAGFDLAHPFDPDAAAPEAGLSWLGGRERLGILVGNTRALWPRFVAWMRDQAPGAVSDPLERYIEQTIDAAFPRARIYYSHRRYDGAFLPFQRLAVATGFGALAPNRLVIHPIYGPWFALRAVIVIDGDPVARAPIDKPCHCESSCDKGLQTAIETGGWEAWLAVRDACTLRAWRYSDDQIRYHYTKVWPDESAMPDE